jgi:hypothetical protein
MHRVNRIVGQFPQQSKTIEEQRVDVSAVMVPYLTRCNGVKRTCAHVQILRVTVIAKSRISFIALSAMLLVLFSWLHIHVLKGRQLSFLGVGLGNLSPPPLPQCISGNFQQLSQWLIYLGDSQANSTTLHTRSLPGDCQLMCLLTSFQTLPSPKSD